MSDLTPKRREEALLNGDDLEPKTREELFIRRIYDKTQEVPEPETRKEFFLKKAANSSGGDVTIEQLNVTENGSYLEQGVAYSPVIVDVPFPDNAYLNKAISDLPQGVASFTDGQAMPLSNLKIDIEAEQSGSGEPSPTNVRPISGWDECNVSDVSTNVWDEETKSGYYDVTTGSFVSNANQLCSKDYISVRPNMTLYGYKDSYTGYGELLFYDAENNYIDYLRATQWINKEFTIPSNCYYITFNLGSAYGATYNHDISINYPSTDTSYHAYNGQTYTIDLDGTRYGGKLDVVSGLLTVESNRYDLGDLSWAYSSPQQLFYCNLPTDALNVTNKNGICEGYKPTSWETMDSASWTHLSNGEFVFSANLMTTGRCALVIKDLNYTDATTFKSAVDDIHVLYPLTTPQTIQLTPTAIKSLLGNNNIFADCGDIEELSYFSKEV